MTDDPPPPPESPQTPVNEALPDWNSEPTPAAEMSEPAQPASEAVPETAAAEPQSEPSPRTQGAASAASAPSTTSGKTPEQDRELLKIARAKIQTKKQRKLEKIMMLFEKKEKITNGEVEKFLHCSDATALRYLNELLKQGKVKRVEKTGAGVEYVKA